MRRSRIRLPMLVAASAVLLLAAGCSAGSSGDAAAPNEDESALTASTQPAQPGEPADLVVTGGPLLTMDPELGVAQAMAVTDGLILAVGNVEEISRFIGESTAVIDLAGRAVLPGFVDAHSHALSDIPEWTPLEAQVAVLEAGITALGDASVEPELLDRFLEDADDFVIDVGLYLTRTDFCGEDAGTWYEAYPPGTKFADRLRVAGVKIFDDGGACNFVAASEPFIDGVDIAPPYFAPDVLADYVRTADEAGYQVLIHAQGDLAITDAQDALAAVIDDGDNALRHRIDHNVILTTEIAARYSEIGIVPVVFGFTPTCADTPWTEFWKGKGENWRLLWEANPDLPIAWHGDDPGAPPLDPLLDLASYVTRAEIAEDGTVCAPEPWLADTTITVDQALAMMTRNSAYALGLDNVAGTLSPGKRADFLVLSADPTAIEPMALFDLELLATYLGGHAAFCLDDDQFCELAMELPIRDESSEPAPQRELKGISASRSRDDHGPEIAFDGDTTDESFWSSGADAPQWVQRVFDEPRAIDRLRFVVFQNPPSDTVHELEFLVDGEWHLAERYEGFTTTGDIVEWAAAPDPGLLVDGFRMTTLASLSWPEWYEIDIEPAD